MGAVNRENTTGDLVRRARRNSAIAVNRIGLQTPHIEAAGSVAAAADENAAAANRRAVASGREADEVCTDHHGGILLHIPERERTVDDIDAVAVWPFILAAGVRGDDVEPVHIDVAAAHLVAGEDLNTASSGYAAQLDPPQGRDGRIVEDCTLGRGSVQTNVVNPIVRGKLNTVAPGGESNPRLIVFATQRLSRRKPDGWRVGQIAAYNNLMDARILGCRDQMLDRVGGSYGGCGF